MEIISTATILLTLALGDSTAVTSRATSGPQPANAKIILLIHSHDYAMPYTKAQDESIRAVINDEFSPEAIFLTETLDQINNFSPDKVPMILEYLGAKYGSRRIDLIITTDTLAFALLANAPKPVFGDTPIVFSAVIKDEFPKSAEGLNTTGVLEEIDVRGTIEVAMNTVPTLRRMVVISGGVPYGNQLREKAEHASAQFKDRLAWEWWTTLPFQELQARAERLGPDTGILFLDYYDTTLHWRHGGSYIAGLRAVTKAPIFVLYDVFLGTGAIGGKVLSGEYQGREAAKLAIRVLRGERASSIPIVNQSPNPCMFDARELARLGISESSLPSGSDVRFREPSLWKRHWINAISVALCLAEGGIIWLLFAQLRARKRAEMMAVVKSEQCRRLVETATEGIIEVNCSQEITFANRRMTELMGEAPDSLVGRRVGEILGSEASECIASMVANLAQEGMRVFDLRVTRHDQRAIWLHLSMAIVRDPHGAVSGVLVMCADATEHKSVELDLHASENRYRALVENDHDAVFLHSATGEVLDVNRKACESLGYLRDELLEVLP